MQTTKTFFVTIATALLAVCAPVSAQQTSPVTVSGTISTAARQVANDTNSSKFTEYRDLREGGFLPTLTLHLFDTSRGRFFDFRGADISLDDQSLSLRGGVVGTWALRVNWVDVPHDYSHKAQTPYVRKAPGWLEVPATVPITFKKLATSAADAPGVLASDSLVAAYQAAFLAPTPLAVQRSFGRVGFEYQGLEALKLSFGYDRQRQSGLKSSFGPIGDRPPRTLNIELTEPVDYRTNEVTLSAEHIGRRFQVQASYLFSDFANRVDTLVWENVRATAAPGATFDVWDRAVSTYGRRALAPDNRYHNAAVAIAGDVPGEGRLSAHVAYGRLEQNQALLAYSYNADVLVNPTLPRASAEAEMTTTQVLVDYVAHPSDRLNVRAWAHRYGLDNRTAPANWQYVTQDTSNLDGTVSYKNKRVNLPYATDRTTVGLDVTYRVGRSTLSAGYERDAADRDYREADTVEHRLTAAVRLRPAPWATLRARYTIGRRDGTYDPFVTRQSYWYAQSEVTDNDNPARTFSNHPDMVRFDVADRRRRQGDFAVTVTPSDAFSLSGTVRYWKDDFDSGVRPSRPLAGTGLLDENAVTPGDQLGWLKSTRLRYGIDAAYVPTDRFSINLFLSVDRGKSFQRSLEFNENFKQKPSAVATAELGPWNRASSQWTADFDDTTRTAGFATTIGVVPNRLIAHASYTASLGDVDITYDGYGVRNWDGTPYPPNHQFAFSSPPTVTEDLHIVDLRFEVPVGQGVAFLVGYTYERFRLDDWQQATTLPWVEPVGSEFLLRDTSRSHQWGNRLFNLGSYLAPSYDGRIGYVMFRYRF